jgi:hypothetical protein
MFHPIENRCEMRLNLGIWQRAPVTDEDTVLNAKALG